MKSRTMLWQASIVAALGGFGLARPNQAAASSGMLFEICWKCETMEGCPTTPEMEEWCDGTPCAGGEPGCYEFGTCSGDKRLVNCVKPIE